MSWIDPEHTNHIARCARESADALMPVFFVAVLAVALLGCVAAGRGCAELDHEYRLERARLQPSVVAACKEVCERGVHKAVNGDCECK